MTAYLPLLILVVASCVVVWYDRRRRRGDDPLGLRPTGELPDTRIALVAGAMSWAALVVLVGTFLAGSGYRPGAVAALLIGLSPNVVVALVLLRFALGGTRTPTLPMRKVVAAGELGGVVAFGASCAIGLAIDSVCWLGGHEMPTQEVARQAGQAQGLGVFAYAAAAVVLAPFAEEVFFRGIMLPAFARVGGERAGLALQAVLFGLVHVYGSWNTWPFAIPLAVVGWCAGWIYLRTGSLAAPIALHMTFNAISFTALRLLPDAVS